MVTESGIQVEDFTILLERKIEHFARTNSLTEKDKNSLRGLFFKIKSIENKIYHQSNCSCVAFQVSDFLCNSNISRNSHTIAENQLQKISVGSKVFALRYGVLSYFKNSHSHCLSEVGTKKASSFYGFCDVCEKSFSSSGIDDFTTINKENFALFFYRSIGREIKATENSVEKHRFLFNNSTDIVKLFLSSLQNQKNLNLLDSIEQDIKKMSFSLHDIRSSFLNCFEAHEKKDVFINNGIITKYENYIMIEKQTSLSGFCCGSMLFENVRLFSEDDAAAERIENFSYILFGLNKKGKQCIKIFVHKKDWIELMGINKVWWKAENQIFAYYLFYSLMHPRPNLYISPQMEPKISKCLDYIKTNEISWSNFSVVDYVKKHVLKILEILNT